MIVRTVNGLELRGAYDRETSMEDWRAGKDFKITGGPYCSNRDIAAIKADGFDMIEFIRRDGSLLERIFLNTELDVIAEVADVTIHRIG